MKLAVIKTGGKQYKVTEGQLLKIEKIAGEKGDKINFDQVLLMGTDDGKTVEIGVPVLTEQKVGAEIIEQGRARKVRVVKYKSKTRYHKVYGHRQHFTQVKITALGGASTATAKKEPVKKAPAKKTEKK